MIVAYYLPSTFCSPHKAAVLGPREGHSWFLHQHQGFPWLSKVETRLETGLEAGLFPQDLGGVSQVIWSVTKRLP